MTSKASFVSLLICGLLLAALLARDGQILLLAIPLLVYLIVGILECPGSMSLQARRTLESAEVAAGAPVHIRVAVENQGEGLTNLCVSDKPPASMEFEGHTQQRLALSEGACTQFAYSLRALRGVYRWTSITARASDPFGLFEIKQELPAYSELSVRPEPLKIRPIHFQPRETLHAPGPTVARLAGTGTDFWGIREYRPGDPLRRLNWRLAGRYPRRLFTNQFQGEEIADFGLIVDARTLTNAYELESAVFEASVRAAAALADVILSKGNRVALLIFGENTSCLFPGYGKRQLSSVIRELCQATLGRNLPFRYLEYFPTRVFPAQSVIIAFSALDARDLDTYARLRSYGYEVVLVSPSPVELTAQTLAPTKLNRRALRAARLERAAGLNRLLALGVEVIDWDTRQPLDPLLQDAARAMAHRRNL